MKEKTLLHYFLCFQMHNKKLHLKSFIIWVRQKTSISKTTLLQREPFLTIMYTMNSSPLLGIKLVFMLAIILSSYHVSSAFNTGSTCFFLLSKFFLKCNLILIRASHFNVSHNDSRDVFINLLVFPQE